MERKALIKKLKKELEVLEKMQTDPTGYKLKSFFIRNILSVVVMVDYALPYLLAGAVVLYPFNLMGRRPIVKDKVISQITDRTKDFGLKEDDSNLSGFVLSTNWRLKDGKYERTVTTYKYRGDDCYSVKELFFMSDSKREELLQVIDVKVIEKMALEASDFIYLKDAIFITLNVEEGDIYQLAEESNFANVVTSLIYLMLSLGVGYKFSEITATFFNVKVSDKLVETINNYQKINSEDMVYWQSLLDLKKANYEMLLDQSEISRPKIRRRDSRE